MLKSEMCRSNPLAKTLLMDLSRIDRLFDLLFSSKMYEALCRNHLLIGGMKLNFNWFQIIIDFLFFFPPPPSVFCMHYLSVFTLIQRKLGALFIKGMIL